MARPKIHHYVDNTELYNHLVKRREIVAKHKEEGKDHPQVDNYLGKVIYDIATHLSYRPNFINYSYKEEMVGDAIEAALKAVDKFDTERGKQPFSYFTQVCFMAFVNRINLEKKQSRIKGKMIQEMPIEELMDLQEHDEDGVPYNLQIIDFLRDNNFITDVPEKKQSKKEEVVEDTLEIFYLEDDE